MLKLDLNKAEETEIKLKMSTGSSKKQKNKKKICFVDYTKAFDYVDHNKLWKILKEMGIPDHLTCLLRNLCAGQEARVRTRNGTMDWFQNGNGVHQGTAAHQAFLEELMLKLQYFGHLMRRADSLEKTLMMGKIKGRRRRGQ